MENKMSIDPQSLPVSMTMDKTDQADLKRAVGLLEKPGAGIRLMNLLGYPIEGIIAVLPKSVGKTIGAFANRALSMAFRVALTSVDRDRPPPRGRLSQRAIVFATGAVGGFFGLPGLVVELPISTTLMLRTIAEIARGEGEDPSAVDTRLACLTVFALGGRSRGDDASEGAYFVARAALAKALSEAAEFVAQRGIMEEGVPVVIRLMTNIASRFGVIVTEKLAVDLIPIIGAAGGASINVLFMSHFQAAARGHFTVRRLERKYGEELVKREYEKLRREG
jgi:hypothetical protein